MAYVRVKWVTGSSGARYFYLYLVENRWIPELKSPRQKVLKYLGAAVSLHPLSVATVKAIMGETPACKNCGAAERLVIDHIIPLSRSGLNDPANLQVLCSACNAAKGATIVETKRLADFDY